MKIITFLGLFNISIVVAQVGIGTTNPTAELEINTSNTGIPAIEINSQTNPVGNATGQISFIGDKLYTYDVSRAKWLSIETIALQFGYSFAADNQILFFGGDVGLDPLTEADTGAKMPFDGTIVYLTIETSGGNLTKSFDILINGSPVGNNPDPTLDGRFNISGGSFNYTDFNINFNAGDYLMIKARSNGSAVNDPAAIVWVKWRE